jgi:hypothetical protein
MNENTKKEIIDKLSVIKDFIHNPKYERNIICFNKHEDSRMFLLEIIKNLYNNNEIKRTICNRDGCELHINNGQVYTTVSYPKSYTRGIRANRIFYSNIDDNFKNSVLYPYLVYNEIKPIVVRIFNDGDILLI